MLSIKQLSRYLFIVVGLLLFILSKALVASTHIEESNLSLEMAVKAAQQNDPWLSGNQHMQSSIESMSVAAGTLPDPRMSIGIANIAADTFNFNQEAMTQFNVGVTQMFPRGESLTLRKKQLELTASQYPLQRQNRRAELTVVAAKLWLDAYLAQESIALIEKDRALFEQLADVAQASYSSAIGKTRQQDIIRAQLELTRLDDRLTMLSQKRESALQQLSQWLNNYFVEEYNNNQNSLQFIPPSRITLARQMPNIKMLNASLYTASKEADPQILFEHFSTHPAVKALDQKIAASASNVELAKQKYKPEWGVSAAYGVRDNAPNGMERADLFSIGVNFDIPLFTANRQDKEVQSAVSANSSMKTEKWSLVRQFIASFENARTQLVKLDERRKLYQSLLLPQMHDQAGASLTAYTNDDGDFSEVVRARIAELNASIDALNIEVERQKWIVQMNYFFMTDPTEIVINNDKANQVTVNDRRGENQ